MPEWLIIIIRALALFVIILPLLRFVGRKQVSQMNFADFVIGIGLGSMVALIVLNVIENLAYGLMGLMIWILLLFFTDYLSLRSKWFHDWIRGKETVLIQHGKVLEDHLKEVRYTGEELLSQLRRKSAFQLSDVEFAVMEANGEISVLLKPENNPITPKAMEWPVAPHAEPQTVILDGNILDEGIRNAGLTRQWLSTELEKIGVALENVFIGQVDSNGDLFVDLFDDAIQVPPPSTKDLLFATLKKCEADLELFALSTKKQEVKQLYEELSQQLNEVNQNLRVVLKR